MARRQRFRPEEREAFTVGTAIEWLNGSHWKPGKIIGEITKDRTGSWYVPIENHATTRTVSKGQLIWGSPGAVRLRTTS